MLKSQHRQEIFDWVSIPPDGTEAKEFSPPGSLRGDYKTVLVWESLNPSKTCAANPKPRVQLLALLRDDKAYWDLRTLGSRIASEMFRAGAESAVRDYRDYIVIRKLCPKAAYNRLVEINKDVI